MPGLRAKGPRLAGGRAVVWFAAAGDVWSAVALIGKRRKRRAGRPYTFRPERALPSELFGPRDFALFLRLASARALLMETAALGAASIRDMAGFLAGWSELEGGGESPRGLWEAAV
jgi:hypothetical protein